MSNQASTPGVVHTKDTGIPFFLFFFSLMVVKLLQAKIVSISNCFPHLLTHFPCQHCCRSNSVDVPSLWVQACKHLLEDDKECLLCRMDCTGVLIWDEKANALGEKAAEDYYLNFKIAFLICNSLMVQEQASLGTERVAQLFSIPLNLSQERAHWEGTVQIL